MNDPQITWYVIEDNSLVVPRSEYYAGSCIPGKTITVSTQLWNNRWGSEAVGDTQGSKIVVYFDSIEDSFLLNLCEVKIDDKPYVPLRIEANRGYVDLERELFGLSNDGSSLNTDNYMNVLLKFGPSDKGLRNSLKNLFMTLEHDAKES